MGNCRIYKIKTLCNFLVISLLLGISACSDENVNEKSNATNGYLANGTGKTSKPIQTDIKAPVNLFDLNVKTEEELEEKLKRVNVNWPKENLVTLSSSKSDCPNTGADSPEYTLHIRYETRYPENKDGDPNILFFDAGFLPGKTIYNTPQINEKIIRDDYEWEREYQVRLWKGTDQKWLANTEEEFERESLLSSQLEKEYSVVTSRALESGNMSILNSPEAKAKASAYSNSVGRVLALMQKMTQNPVQGLNQDITDFIEVKAPSPAWSFKYDNHLKEGDPMYKNSSKRAKKLRSLDSESLINIGEQLSEILAPIQDIGEKIVDTGTKNILGYTCEVQSLKEWGTEICFAEIQGRKIDLWSKIDKMETTAIYLDEDACVSLNQFGPPKDVNFLENYD